MEEILSFLLLVRIIGILVCIKKAKDLNRHQVGWGFFGFFFPIIAMIWIYYMKPLIIWNKNVSLKSEGENMNSYNNNSDFEIIKIEKPINVTKGINLLVIPQALSIIFNKESNSGNFFILIFFLGLFLFFSKQLYIGKKWARTMFLILFIISLLLFISYPLLLPDDFSILLKNNPCEIGISIILYITQIIGFFYIYSKESNKWYNSINNATVNTHKNS